MEEVPESDNVDGKANNSVEELVIDSETGKYLVLLEKLFNEKQIQQEISHKIKTQKTVQFRIS